LGGGLPFGGEKMPENAGVAPGDPRYFAERARYRRAADDRLRRKFDPVARMGGRSA